MAAPERECEPASGYAALDSPLFARKGDASTHGFAVPAIAAAPAVAATTVARDAPLFKISVGGSAWRWAPSLAAVTLAAGLGIVWFAYYTGERARGAAPAVPAQAALNPLAPGPAAAVPRRSGALPEQAARLPGAPRAKPRYRVQLFALASATAAEREWSRLRRSQGDLFAKLPASVVPGRSAGNRTVHQLQAGSFATAKAARRLCVKARRRKLDCIVVISGGK